ncbi:hypothetical protein ACUYF5_24525 (plasmid) [Escherichia coli]
MNNSIPWFVNTTGNQNTTAYGMFWQYQNYKRRKKDYELGQFYLYGRQSISVPAGRE